MRLKYLLDHVDERKVTEDTPLMSVSKVRGVVPRSEIADDEGRADDIGNYKTCQVSDLVINRMAAYQGALGIAQQVGAISPDYMVLRIRRGFVPSFLGYFFKSHWMHSQMSSLVKGIGSIESNSARTPRLSWSDLKNLDVEIPPLDEQQAIADFLDRELAQIDALMDRQATLVALLGERRSALVSAETQDFDGSPSWNVVRVSQICRLVNGYPFDADLFAPDGEVPLVRIRDLKGQEFETFVSRDNVPKQSWIGNSDVLIGMDGDFNAVFWQRGEACLNQRVALLRFEDESLARFVSLAIAEPLRRLNDLTYSTTVKHLSSGQIRSLRICVPPQEDLEAVVSGLLSRLSQLDALMSAATGAIQLLAERRQTLISAAVTGKIDVRKVA